VRELCLISLQQPQRLSARTSFAGVLLSLQLLPFFAVIRLDTLPTVRVSSARMYRLLQLLRFVNALIARRRQSIPSCIILYYKLSAKRYYLTTQPAYALSLLETPDNFACNFELALITSLSRRRCAVSSPLS
jgi:hypothetical protein